MGGTPSDDHNFSKMETDVALLKQFNEKVVEPALKDIKSALENMSYVSHREFEEYQGQMEKALKDAKEEYTQSKREGIIKTTLAGLFGAVVTTVVLFIISKTIEGTW